MDHATTPQSPPTAATSLTVNTGRKSDAPSNRARYNEQKRRVGLLRP
jgi:hypothetical protein